MPRTRYIRPEFFDDTTLAELPIPARYLYAGLWCWTDRAGVFEFNARLIRKRVFPYDDLQDADVERLLQGLVQKHRIIVAEHDGKLYGFIPKFARHQWFHGGEKPRFDVPVEIFKGSAADPDQFTLGPVGLQNKPCTTTEPRISEPRCNGNGNGNWNGNDERTTAAALRRVSVSDAPLDQTGSGKKTEPVRLRNGDILRCQNEWLETLKFFKTPRNLIANEDYTIARKVQADGADNVRLALIGARHEPARDGFDPAKHLSLDRVLGTQYAKNVNRGIQAEQKRLKKTAVAKPDFYQPEPERVKPIPEAAAKVRKMLRDAGYHTHHAAGRGSSKNPPAPECLTTEQIEKEKARQIENLKKMEGKNADINR